jgi:hypothetical protein
VPSALTSFVVGLAIQDAPSTRPEGQLADCPFLAWGFERETGVHDARASRRGSWAAAFNITSYAPIQPATPALGCTLTGQDSQRVPVADLRGKIVMLAFRGD